MASEGLNQRVLHYRPGSDGRAVACGEEHLSDLHCPGRIQRLADGAPLRHVKRMIDDWFKKKIVVCSQGGSAIGSARSRGRRRKPGAGAYGAFFPIGRASAAVAAHIFNALRSTGEGCQSIQLTRGKVARKSSGMATTWPAL